MLPGTKARIDSLPWPKMQEENSLLPKWAVHGDVALLPLEGTKPGCHSGQHKFHLTCLINIRSSQFTDFTILS